MYLVIIFPINISKGREDQTSCFGGGVCLVLSCIRNVMHGKVHGGTVGPGGIPRKAKKFEALQDEVFCKASRMGNWSG